MPAKKVPGKAKKTAGKTAAAVVKEQGPEVGVVDTHGKAKGKIHLPKELFAAPVNKHLLAQAVRVYLTNQRAGGASTKTRGEVEGSTRKIYRQKGTGRARHGAIRAPVFVGGGIIFGPKPKDFRLSLPSQMKRAALASALTSQLTSHHVIVVDGLEKLAPKTRNFAQTWTHIGATKKTLLVTLPDAKTVVQGARNLENTDIMPAQNLHTYAVLAHDTIIFTKDALKHVAETFM